MMKMLRKIIKRKKTKKDDDEKSEKSEKSKKNDEDDDPKEEEGKPKKKRKPRKKKQNFTRPVVCKVLNSLELEIKKIAGGVSHTVLLTKKGEVYSWGRNHYGQLGHGIDDEMVEEPRKIENIERVVDIACGALHTVLVTRDGVVYAFGLTRDGRIPSSNEKEKSPMVVCEEIKKNKVVGVACGKRHTLLIATEN